MSAAVSTLPVARRRGVLWLTLGVIGATACGDEPGAVSLSLLTQQSPLLNGVIATLRVFDKDTAIDNNSVPVAPVSGGIEATLPFTRLPLAVALRFEVTVVMGATTLLVAEKTQKLSRADNSVVLGAADVRPGSADSDNDGFSNLHELLAGHDANSASDRPPGKWCDEAGVVAPCDGACSELGNCLATGSCNDDGVRDPSEECDGTDLGGLTCQSLGYAGGSLGCASCELLVTTSGHCQ